MAFVSAYAFVCQSVLTEKDDVTTAIRIADIFLVPVLTSDSNYEHVHANEMTLFMSLRFTADESDPHTITFDLVRPNGEMKSFNVVTNHAPQSAKYPDTDKTFTALGPIGVEPKQLGRHAFVIRLDGNEVATAYFTLIGRPTESESAPL